MISCSSKMPLGVLLVFTMLPSCSNNDNDCVYGSIPLNLFYYEIMLRCLDLRGVAREYFGLCTIELDQAFFHVLVVSSSTKYQ